MKIGDLIKLNTTRVKNFPGTWIIVSYESYPTNYPTSPIGYTFRIVGVDHDGRESDLVVDARWAERNMMVISLCE